MKYLHLHKLHYCSVPTYCAAVNHHFRADIKLY